MAARSAPSECDWLTVAATIATKYGELALAEALRVLVARLLGQGDPEQPAHEPGGEGQGSAQDQEVTRAQVVLNQ